MLRLKGRVFSGKGEGAKFVKLSWASGQIEEKMDFAPYPGTLNIRLTTDSVKLKNVLMNSAGMKISPAPGYCSGKLFKAEVGGLDCGVVIPEVSGYPEDVIEVVVSTNLRERLHLVDGSRVEVKVMF